MKYALDQLIDLPQLQRLMETLFAATGINHALLDNDGKVLTAVGWQEICTRFHRVNPETCARCTESDLHIQEHLQEGPYVGYSCPQGLVDYATPVIIEGEHIATIFTGQMLHEEPDVEFFRQQAHRYGFDEAAYLEALDQVKVIPKERMDAIMAFQVQLAQMLANNGLNRLRQLEAEEGLRHFNQELVKRVDERTQELALRNQQFKDEAEKREQDEAALKRAYAYNRSLIEASLDPLVTIGQDGRITDVNSATERATGLPRAELIGRKFSDFFSEPEKAEAGYQQVFREGIVRDYPLELRHRDGHVTPVVYNAAVYRDEKGAIIGVFAAARDITERKHAEAQVRQLTELLEARVARRTAELEEANRELIDFSYSISHDLRTPLRAIDGFVRLLLDDYLDRLDEEGQRLLHVVSENARSMGQLLDDILYFIRLGRQEIKKEPLDLAMIAQEEFLELQAADPDRVIRLEIGEMPPALADRAMLRQVMFELLSNAFKFSKPKPEALIQVGGTAEPEHNHYYVKDNGVGFDMEYVGKLFKVFERVHTRGQFEGTGTGLAIVKRIITRHGGEVWAEGQLNEGTVIHFTLPRMLP